ncbi:zona pellucida sperm-binding protein 1-like [Amia ocellicauda]|uniref:zona pellucida sperm-binding protein 1-like n=1 Tax=Amia ocellicauda TaxID=2972642 RepID=UPI0034649D34
MGVQLRIAKDASYSQFYPQFHRPLRLLLGKPLYLEVRLLSPPDPSLVLLVHYCLAYPPSAQAAWVLLYDGCPNPLDEQHSSTLHTLRGPPLFRHRRRFHIQAFQFLKPGPPSDSEEEVYFMCSTEVCSPSQGPCVEGCFDGRIPPPGSHPSVQRACNKPDCPGVAP